MATPTLFQVVADQRKDLPVVPTTEKCSGKTYIVTGGNGGLGFEAARHLAGFGAAKVVIAARNARSGEEAKAEIERSTGTHGVVEVWPLDLASFDSVKAFAKMAIDRLERIDALIESAGVGLDQWTLSEGHETTITVNVISTLLLAVLLLPKMSESAKQFGSVPHLVIVSSEAGLMDGTKVALDKIKYSPLKNLDDVKMEDMKTTRYQISKLMQIFATRQLATLLPVDRTGVVLNVLNPGLCDTGLRRNMRCFMRMQISLANKVMGRTPEMGSRTLLHAAMAGKESHGCYLGACEIQEFYVPSWVTDDEGKAVQKRAWDDIAKELERIEPGCVQRLL